MYYPYFRGKQFDLLALRTLLENNVLSKKVIPIIEPIKNTATLHKLLTYAQKKQHPFYLVQNPKLGEFNTSKASNSLQKFPAKKALFVDQPLESMNTSAELLIIDQPSVALNSDWTGNQKPVFLPPEFRLLNKIIGKKIISQDHFTRLPKLSFYQTCVDELFSTDHLTYKQRGFFGFSDFSIDSRIYYEKSYPSSLLSLHLLYFSKEQLRIHHFLSTEEPANQKEKFLELMQEVYAWQNILTQENLTKGLALLMHYAAQKKFPGMGVMRKASVMHHMELMSRYLDSKK